ncbi:MAG: nitrogen fixation protein, partial [Dolichospermum sp.]
PQQFLEIAKQHDYYFSIEALGWILTEIKLSSKVRIFNPTGQVFVTPVIARICTGSWISLAESWGLVPPFCHINKPVRWDGDINDEKYSLRQCFLPPGYFNQRLIM